MINPEAAAIRAGIRREPVDPSRSVVDDRNAWESGAAAVPLPSSATEELTEIGGVACRIVRTASVEEHTTIVYMHGGGYVSGSSLTTRVFGARLSAATRSSVVLVDYRLLPEHAFPAPGDDVVAVATAAIERSGAGHVLLAGDSSGAALAVSASVLMRDHGLPLAAGIVSICGAFDATLSSPSVDSADEPMLDRTHLEHWRTAIEPVADPVDPRVSPLFAELHDLPPMLLLAGGDDVWRDDSLRLAGALATCGGSVELHVFPGMWHCWPVWGEFPESRRALDLIDRFRNRLV